MNVKNLECGDLVEYIGPLSATSTRPRYGLVFYVKEIVNGSEIGVYFSGRMVMIHSKYLEKR